MNLYKLVYDAHKMKLILSVASSQNRPYTCNCATDPLVADPLELRCCLEISLALRAMITLLLYRWYEDTAIVPSDRTTLLSDVNILAVGNNL